MIRYLIALVIVSTSVAALGAALPQNERVPGGVAVVRLPTSGAQSPRVSDQGKRVMTVRHDGRWYAIVGIPLGAKSGAHTLTVKNTRHTAKTIGFHIHAKTYPVQRLTIKNHKLVNPGPAALSRIHHERRHMDTVIENWLSRRSPDLTFIWPAKGPQTSAFGLRRILNGEAHSPHSGIDIGAAAGAPIHAPASGAVTDVGRYYFNGRTVFINHGQGLVSVLCHLSSIDVKPGEHVNQGQVVGRIGSSGRTTGANLHWSVYLNGTVVDPHAFLPADAGK